LASDKVNFPEVGSIAQAMKHQIRGGNYWDDLPPASKEALDQIATLIARIVSSDGTHWDGIVGFAQAAQAALPPAKPTPTIDIERNIRSLVAREIPNRNGEAS
jgi:hypothetical protein